MYHIFYHPDGTSLDNTAKLTGVTITKGNANGDEEHNVGGVVYNSYNSSPELNDCEFTNNEAEGEVGGGMFNDSSSPELNDCEFTNNEAEGEVGGGIFNDSSSPKLTDCEFTNNKAVKGGGAIYSDKDSKPNFDADTKKTFTLSNDPYGKNNANFKEAS